MLPALAALIIVCVSRDAVAEDWMQFRGPGAGGVVADKVLPADWGPDKNVAWKVKLPGVAWSQPIVSGEKIFLTTAVTEKQQKPCGGQSGPGFSVFSPSGISRALFHSADPPDAIYRWKILCLDGTTGTVLWEQTAREARPNVPIHPSNTYASETPVTDGELVIAYFGMTGLYCYDLAGKLLWSKELGSYPTQFGWGTGSSPALDGERIFVQCDNEKTSFLVALDKKSGEELWRAPREEKSNWCTPHIWRNTLRCELVTAGGDKIRSYNLESGELLWEMDARGRSAATPVSDQGLLFVGSVDRMTGTKGVLVAIRPGAAGDISLKGKETSNSFVAWSVPRVAPQIASPLLYEGCVYVLQQQGGIITCLDATTGKQHYRQRLPGASGFMASPWANDGKLFCLDENGQTFVLQPGPEFKVIGTSKLDEMFWSSPAVIGDRLLLRGVDHFYCIAKQE
jgi:outer membrane protein assembly factor BamB